MRKPSSLGVVPGRWTMERKCSSSPRVVLPSSGQPLSPPFAAGVATRYGSLAPQAAAEKRLSSVCCTCPRRPAPNSWRPCLWTQAQLRFGRVLAFRHCCFWAANLLGSDSASGSRGSSGTSSGGSSSRSRSGWGCSCVVYCNECSVVLCTIV